ncbi:MAG: head GIN domain-containing protein [Sphingomonas sp.]
MPRYTDNAYLLALLPLTACSLSANGAIIPADGSADGRSYAVNGFTEVRLSGSDNVEVRQGTAFAVTAKGDPAILDKLKIERQGRSLVISRKGDGWGSWTKSGRVTVFITMPRLAKVSLGGSGNMKVDRIDGELFEASLGGSGDIDVASANIRRASFSIAGSGRMAIGGTAEQLSISIAGSGDVDAKRLVVQRANISMAGSGTVRADVRGTGSISMFGSGNIDLGDHASCHTSKFGSGTVRCGRAQGAG